MSHNLFDHFFNALQLLGYNAVNYLVTSLQNFLIG